MKYKVALIILALFFINVTEVDANGVFESTTGKTTVSCMGSAQQSIIKDMEQIKLDNGIMTGLDKEYFVVIKTVEGTIVYVEPNYTQSTYNIEVDNGNGIENYLITSVIRDENIPSSRTNNETTLDLTRFAAEAYIYYVYPTDALLASIPTDSTQFQNIVGTQRPGDVKFCTSLAEKSPDETYVQIRPNYNITPPVFIPSTTVYFDYTSWVDEILRNAELDKYTYDWAQNYWTTDSEVRQNEYNSDTKTYLTGETKIGDPLICEPTQVGLETKTYHKGEEFTVENNDYCTVNCVEQLTISYGEPIALLAGMGFTYDITIDTIVDCETEVNEDKIAEQFGEIDKDTCTMRPSCWGGIFGEMGSDGAGPTEDFEQCVYECDGGVYSDACSQSCYDQVYNGVETSFGYSNKILVSPYLTNSTASYQATPPFGVSVGSSIQYGTFWSCNDYDVFFDWMTAVYQDYSNEIGVDANLDYTIPYVYDTYKNSYTYYCDASSSVRAYSNYRFADSYRKYILDYNNGLAFRAVARGCDAYCSWVGDCDKGVSRTEEDIYADLNRLQASVSSSLAQCSNVVADYEEKENSTYTSVITNKDIDDKPDDVNSGQTTLYSIYKEDSFENATSNSNRYREALYRFPETYTNLDGEFIYPNENGVYGLTPTTLSAEYKSTGHQFMTSFTSRTTNLDWYNWYFENVDDIEKIENGEIANQLIYNGSNPDYNIETELRDVGIFDWAIDVDCYYALKSSVDDYDDTGDNKVVEGGLEYIFRPIDLANVFPNESGESHDDGTYDRVPQWNWTDNAAFTTVLGYEINPIALTEKIEQEDYSVYDEEPDYVITLDRNSISEIRSYNASQGSYLQYDPFVTKCEPYEDGRTVCSSDFRYGAAIDVVEVNAKLGCNNSDSISGCEIFGGTE